MKNSNQIFIKVVKNIFLSFVTSVVVISSVGPFLSWTASDFIPVCFLFFIVYSFFTDEKFNIMADSEQWVKDIISELKGIVLTFLITVLVGSACIILIYLLLTKYSGMDRESALEAVFFLFWVVNISSILRGGLRALRILIMQTPLRVSYEVYPKFKSFMKRIVKEKKEIIQLTVLVISTFFIFSVAWDLLHPTQGAKGGDIIKTQHGENNEQDTNFISPSNIESWINRWNYENIQKNCVGDWDDVTNSDSLIINRYKKYDDKILIDLLRADTLYLSH